MTIQRFVAGLAPAIIAFVCWVPGVCSCVSLASEVCYMGEIVKSKPREQDSK